MAGEYGDERRVPAIPDVRSNNVGDVLRAVKEWIEVRQGVRGGNALDRAVTVRDLLNTGTATPLAMSYITGGATTLIPFTLATDPAVPPTPTNLQAAGAVRNVILSWDFPSEYSRLAYFEVWRSATDALGDATKIRQTDATRWADPVSEGATFYYWVRAVSDAGESPFNAVAGVKGETPTSVGAIVNLVNQSVDDTGLLNQLTLKQSADGYVSGYGLASTPSDDPDATTFSILADRFLVTGPAAGGVLPSVPFFVQATPTTVNGVEVPAGVYMSAAFIMDGIITNAKIGNLAVDDAKIASMDAAKIATGFLDAARIEAGSITADKIGTGTLNASVQISVGTAPTGDPALLLSGTGEIISTGADGDKARFYYGAVEIWKRVPSVGDVVYKALSRSETGVAENDTLVTIPGYFKTQPRVIVSPNSLMLYNKDYANQNQAINCQAENIAETSSGSMVWQFTPKATLTLGAATGTTSVNVSGGTSVSDSYTSAAYVTPANCLNITANARIKSVRSNGASSCFRRQYRLRVDHSATSGGAYTAGTWGAWADVGDTTGYITANIAKVFPSAGTWWIKVNAEFRDKDGTTFTGTITGSFSTETLNVGLVTDSVLAPSGDTVTKTVNYTMPVSVVNPTWEIYQIRYVANYTASFKITAFIGDGVPWGVFSDTIRRAGVAHATYTVSSANFVPHQQNYSYPASVDSGLIAGAGLTYNRNYISAFLSAKNDSGSTPTAGNPQVSIQFASGSVTIYRRNTAAGNEFMFDSYNFNLTTAQVLATGTLNYIALGD